MGQTVQNLSQSKQVLPGIMIVLQLRKMERFNTDAAPRIIFRFELWQSYYFPSIDASFRFIENNWT